MENKTILIRIPKELKKDFVMHCFNRNTSMSEEIKRLIAFALKSSKAPSE